MLRGEWGDWVCIEVDEIDITWRDALILMYADGILNILYALLICQNACFIRGGSWIMARHHCEITAYSPSGVRRGTMSYSFHWNDDVTCSWTHWLLKWWRQVFMNTLISLWVWIWKYYSSSPTLWYNDDEHVKINLFTLRLYKGLPWWRPTNAEVIL